jgi:AcrR family transcriptional regulator
MQREEKSERSRRLVLDSALRLFSHQGFRGTSVREIAETAGVSIGNVYHHFPDKETIFRNLLDEYWATLEDRRYPFMRELTAGRFPDNLEQLGFAARDSVRQFRRHIALIYVDVIEFEGTHIRKFYGEMANRLKAVLKEDEIARIQSRLRPGVSPISALLLTIRFFFNYFSVEILFGVPEPFGKDSTTIVREIGDILRNGMVS